MSDETKSCSVPSAAEPTATRSAVPMWILVGTLLLLFLGGVYFDHHSGWFDAKIYSPYASAETLAAYQPQSGAAAALALGKAKYDQVCGICHGPDGLGKPNQAPPLALSEWVNVKGYDRLTHIPLVGLAGPLQVEGKDWNLNMAPMGATLSDTELAAVLTYIRTSWGNKAGEVTPEAVKAVRAAIGGHPQAISGDQMKTMPE